MKKTFLCTLLLLFVGFTALQAQSDGAEIKFEKVSHDFGKFSEKSPVVTCEFEFSNTGNKPLVIVQAHAPCNCTVPDYTKEPINPGQKGTVKVTYNGAGKYPGVFIKTITIRSNGKTETVRLTIKGEMIAQDK